MTNRYEVEFVGKGNFTDVTQAASAAMDFLARKAEDIQRRTLLGNNDTDANGGTRLTAAAAGKEAQQALTQVVEVLKEFGLSAHGLINAFPQLAQSMEALRTGLGLQFAGGNGAPVSLGTEAHREVLGRYTRPAGNDPYLKELGAARLPFAAPPGGGRGGGGGGHGSGFADDEYDDEDPIGNAIRARRGALQRSIAIENEIADRNRDLYTLAGEEQSLRQRRNTLEQLDYEHRVTEADSLKVGELEAAVLRRQANEGLGRELSITAEDIKNRAELAALVETRVAEEKAQTAEQLAGNADLISATAREVIGREQNARAVEEQVARYHSDNAPAIGRSEAVSTAADAKIDAAREKALAADSKYAESQASRTASLASQKVQQERLLSVLPGYVANLSELAVLHAKQRRQIEQALNADREANANAIGLANADKVLTDARIKAAEATSLQKRGPELARSQASSTISDADVAAKRDKILAKSEAYAQSLADSAVSQEKIRRVVDASVTAYRGANAAQIGNEQATRALVDAQVSAAKATALVGSPETARRYTEARAATVSAETKAKALLDEALVVDRKYLDALGRSAVAHEKEHLAVEKQTASYRDANAPAIGQSQAKSAEADAKVALARARELEGSTKYAKEQAGLTASAAAQKVQQERLLAVLPGYVDNIAALAVLQAKERRQVEEALNADRAANVASIGLANANKVLVDARIKEAEQTALRPKASTLAKSQASATESAAYVTARRDTILAASPAYLASLSQSAIAHEKERVEVEKQTAAYRTANAKKIGQADAASALADAQIAAARAVAQAKDPRYAEAQASLAESSASQRVQSERLLAVMPGYVENVAELAVLQAQERREVEKALNADREANSTAIGLADANKALIDARIKAVERADLVTRGTFGVTPTASGRLRGSDGKFVKADDPRIGTGAYARSQAETAISDAQTKAQQDRIQAASKVYVESLGESAVSREKERVQVEKQTAAYRSANAAQIGQAAAASALADAQVAAERGVVLANNPEYAESQASLTASTAKENVARERLLAVLPGYVDDLAALAVLQAQQRREVEQAVNADREANAISIGLANANRALIDARIKAVEAAANVRQGPQLVRYQSRTAIDDAAVKANLDETLAASRSYISSLSRSAVAHEQERVAVQERVAAYRAANATRIGEAQASSTESDAKIAAVKAEQLSTSKSYLDDVVSEKIYSSQTALATREALVQMQDFASQSGQAAAAQREVKVAIAERLIKLRRDLAIANEQVALAESGVADDQESLRMKAQLLVANRRLQEATNAEAQAVIKAGVESGDIAKGTLFQQLETRLRQRQGGPPVLPDTQPTLGQFVGEGGLRAVRFGVGATAGFAAIQGLKASIEEAENLDLALSQTKVTLQAIGQDKNFDHFRNQILDVARETGTASDQVATLATQLAATFQSTDIAAANVRTSLQVAKITGADLETTTQQLRAASEGFGLSGSGAFRQISDAAISTANVFGVKATDIIGFLAGVGAEAKQAGLDVRQVAAIGGAIADVSVKSGATLGDTFARILPQISAQAGKVVQVLNTSPTGRGIAAQFSELVAGGKTGAALETLIANMGKLNYEQQNLVLHTIGGRRETEALTAVVENYQREQQAAAAASGSTQQRFDALQHTLKQQLSELLEGLKQIGISLGDLGILTVLTDVVGLLHTATNAVGFLAHAFGDVSRSLGGIPARIAEIAIALKALQFLNGGGGGSTGVAVRGIGSAIAGGSSAFLDNSFVVGSKLTGALGPVAASGLGPTGTTLVGAAGITAGSLGIGAAALGAYVAYNHFVVDASRKLDTQVASWNQGEMKKSYEELQAERRKLGNEGPEGGFDKQPIAPGFLSGGIRGRSFLSRFTGTAFASSFNHDIERKVKQYNALGQDEEKQLQAEVDSSTSGIESAFKVLGDLQPPDLDKTIEDLQRKDPNLAIASILHEVAKKYNLSHEDEIALLGVIGTAAGADAALQSTQDDIDRINGTLDQLKAQASAGQPVLPQILDQMDALVERQRQLVQEAADKLRTEPIEGNREADQKALDSAAKELDTRLADRAKQLTDAITASTESSVTNIQNSGADVSTQITQLRALLGTQGLSNTERAKIAQDIVNLIKQQHQTELAAVSSAADAARVLNEALPDDLQADILAGQVTASDIPVQRIATDIANAGLTTAQFIDQVAQLMVSAHIASNQAAIIVATKARDALVAALGSATGEGQYESLQRSISDLNVEIAGLSADSTAIQPGAGGSISPDDVQRAVQAIKQSSDQITAIKQAINSDPLAKAQADYATSLDELKTAGIDPNNIDWNSLIARPGDDAKTQANKAAARQALQDYFTAQREIADSQKAISDAQLGLNDAHNDGVAVALAADEQHKADLDVQAAKSLGLAARLNAAAERVKADKAMSDALRTLFDSQMNLAIAYANQSGDTVTAAQDQVREAQRAVADRIAQDVSNGVDQSKDNTLIDLQTALVNAQSQSEQAYVQDRRDMINFQLEMHQVSTSQAIAQLQALEAQVKMTTNNQKDIRDIELQIHQLRGQADANLQFNLPTDINLPTLYDVRRLNQTPSGTGYVDNRQVSIVFQINDGMDVQTAMHMVTDAVGSTSTTYGTALKRY